MGETALLHKKYEHQVGAVSVIMESLRVNSDFQAGEATSFPNTAVGT
jgi:hypothetical protein